MNNETILIVDDEINVLKSLKRLLSSTTYNVITAVGGEEGLRKFDDNTIQLVITDYKMPDMNGVEFLCKVKEKYPDTIRIVLSGYADVASIVEAINHGHVYKFLGKPWNDQEMLTTIKRSLELYKLQFENQKLLNELKEKNSELKKLATSLEQKVNERTKDLQIKNNALEITQKILFNLNGGVLCIDSAGMIVYINRSFQILLNNVQLILGQSFYEIENVHEISTIQKQIKAGKSEHFVVNKELSLFASYSSLPDDKGIIISLFKFQNMKLNYDESNGKEYTIGI